jgi:hypothetical protein
MSTQPKLVDPTVVSDLQRPLWNRSAAAYADVFEGLVDQAVEPLLDAAGIAAGSRVLDVAAGFGDGEHADRFIVDAPIGPW